MKKFIISLLSVTLSLCSALNAASHTKIVDVKPKLNKSFMIKAYTKEYDNLVGAIGTSFTPADYVKDALKRNIVKILLVDKKTAGFIVYNKKGHIYAIYVAPAYRSKGYSKLLLNHVARSSTKYSVKKLELDVFDYNPKAVKAFKKAGFVWQKKSDKAIRMTKNLKK